MKKYIPIIVLIILALSPYILTAQPMPFDDGGNNGGEGGGPLGGGAPLGEGLLLLFALAAGYGTKKFIAMKKKIMD